MLPDILLMNGNICEFESKFGVTFARETAAVQTYNSFKSFHLLANEWTRREVGPNKRIVGLVAGVDPSSNQGGFAAIVFINSGTTFTGYEVWDLNGVVIGAGPVSTGGPKYDGGPDVHTFGIVNSTHKNVVVTKNDTDNTIRVRGTNDISILWGLIDIDTCDFDITIDLKTLKEV